MSEEQGERLRGELDNIRMGQGEDFDVYATRVESLAEQVFFFLHHILVCY